MHQRNVGRLQPSRTVYTDWCHTPCAEKWSKRCHSVWRYTPAAQHFDSTRSHHIVYLLYSVLYDATQRKTLPVNQPLHWWWHRMLRCGMFLGALQSHRQFSLYRTRVQSSRWCNRVRCYAAAAVSRASQCYFSFGFYFRFYFNFVNGNEGSFPFLFPFLHVFPFLFQFRFESISVLFPFCTYFSFHFRFTTISVFHSHFASFSAEYTAVCVWWTIC